MSKTTSKVIATSPEPKQPYAFFKKDGERIDISNWHLEISAKDVLLHFKCKKFFPAIWQSYNFNLMGADGKEMSGLFKVTNVTMHHDKLEYFYICSLLGDIHYHL